VAVRAPPAAPPVGRWTTGDLARRRSLSVARAELEAAQLRGDPLPVTEAWLLVIDAIEAAERDRSNPRADEAAG
jgi:hypothetical protein